MERWDTIKASERMERYIRQHLSDPITLRDLAREAGYSPWHSARIFKEATGTAPFEYIRSLRLHAAALRMSQTHDRVIDVALDFVFDSHEGFTRAFTKQFGVSPRDYRKDSSGIKTFLPARVQDYYLRLQKGEIDVKEKKKADTVFVQVIDRPARKLILKRGTKATHYFEYCEEVGCEIWDILSGVKDALYEPIGMWLPEKMISPGTSLYVQGVEMAADYAGPVPEGFELIDLPPCKMMVFQGQPYDDANFAEAIEDLWNVMNSYDPQLYGFRWADEDAPRFQLAPMGYRGYIEARPVRPLGNQ